MYLVYHAFDICQYLCYTSCIMKNTKRFLFKLEPGDRKMLDELAEAEDRSLAWIIRDAIRKRWYQAFGHLKITVDK